jgi:hypothetical protein
VDLVEPVVVSVSHHLTFAPLSDLTIVRRISRAALNLCQAESMRFDGVWLLFMPCAFAANLPTFTYSVPSNSGGIQIGAVVTDSAGTTFIALGEVRAELRKASTWSRVLSRRIIKRIEHSLNALHRISFQEHAFFHEPISA